jgi:site-specific DNA recombinase
LGVVEGSTRKGSFVYFRCRPRATSGHDAANRWPGHPSDVYVAQDKLLPGVLGFFAERVFGERRRELLLSDLDATTEAAYRGWEDRLAALERALADLDSRRSRLLTALETTDDPDGVLVQDVTRRLNELVEQQRAAIADLQHHRANPPDADGQAPELLDRIGRVSHAKLDATPEPVLRTLFDAFGLTVSYDPAAKLATVEVTVDDESLPGIESAVRTVADGSQAELGISLARSEGFEPPTF